MNNSVVATRLRAKIARFSGEVSVGLGAVARRFVSEMLYGIQASGSVLLTRIRADSGRADCAEEDARAALAQPGEKAD